MTNILKIKLINFTIEEQKTADNCLCTILMCQYSSLSGISMKSFPQKVLF